MCVTPGPRQRSAPVVPLTVVVPLLVLDEGVVVVLLLLVLDEVVVPLLLVLGGGVVPLLLVLGGGVVPLLLVLDEGEVVVMLLVLAGELLSPPPHPADTSTAIASTAHAVPISATFMFSIIPSSYYCGCPSVAVVGAWHAIFHDHPFGVR